MNQVVPGKVQQLIQYWIAKEEAASVNTEGGANTTGLPEIDIRSHLSRLALDVIGEVAFSHNFHGLDSIGEWSSARYYHHHEEEDVNVDLPNVGDDMFQALQKHLKMTPQRFMLYALGLEKLDGAGLRCEKAMNDAASRVIQNAQQDMIRDSTTVVQNDDNHSNIKHDGKQKKYQSILDLLLESRMSSKNDNDSTTSGQTTPLTDIELRDEIKTFMIAGHETTSAWCYWAIFALTKYPDIQEKVYEDIMKQTDTTCCAPQNNGGQSSGPTVMTVEAVEKMEYLDAFMKECLRLYPPAGLLIRRTTDNIEFNGTTLPKDTRINIPIYLIHRHEAYWPNKPLEFLPERWLMVDERKDTQTKSNRYTKPYSHPYAYLPFSHGARNCIGYRFATMEAKLILAGLVHAFHFRLVPSQQHKEFVLKHTISLTSTPRVKVTATQRRNKACVGGL